MIRSWEALQWMFFSFNVWFLGARNRKKVVRLWFSILLLPLLLSLIFSGALSCVYSIDPWSLLQTRALHQSYELRSFPSMPCNSLPSVRDPSPSACSRRRRLPDRTAKSQHASGGVEYNALTCTILSSSSRDTTGNIIERPQSPLTNHWLATFTRYFHFCFQKRMR